MSKRSDQELIGVIGLGLMGTAMTMEQRTVFSVVGGDCAMASSPGNRRTRRRCQSVTEAIAKNTVAAPVKRRVIHRVCFKARRIPCRGRSDP